MKISVIKSLFFFVFLTLMVSCSHHQNSLSSQNHGDRSVAAEECYDSIRGEYHSYFDNVEKCIEKEK